MMGPIWGQIEEPPAAGRASVVLTNVIERVERGRDVVEFIIEKVGVGDGR